MARKQVEQRLGSPRDLTIAAPEIRLPSLGNIGAPKNIGSGLMSLASAFKDFSSTLKQYSMKQEDKDKQLAEAQAMEDIALAQREGTIEQFYKATQRGDIPEGASPAYNDYRKAYVVKDIIQNKYQKSLNDSLSVLLDPDVDPATKDHIMQTAYTNAGLDKIQIDDPIVRREVSRSLLSVQANLRQQQTAKYAEVNKLKMVDTISREAVNTVRAVQDPIEIQGSILESIQIAKRAGVKQPTNSVVKEYLTAVEQLSVDEPERALEMLDAMDSMEIAEGAELLGNTQLAGIAIKLRQGIEQKIDQEDQVLEKRYKNSYIKIVRAIEDTISVEDRNNPERIKDAFDAFLASPKAQELGARYLKDINDQRDMRISRAQETMLADANAKFVPDRLLQMEAKQYGVRVQRANSQEDVMATLQEIDERQDLTVREKADLKLNVQQAGAKYEFAKVSFSEVLPDNELQIDEVSLQKFRQQYGYSSSYFADNFGHFKDMAQDQFSEIFEEELSKLGKAVNLSQEEALTFNKSIYKVDEYGNVELDTSSNLVQQASNRAKEIVFSRYQDNVATFTYQLNEQNKLRYTTSLKELGAIPSDVFKSARDKASMQDLNQEDRNKARLALTNARLNLFQIADKLNTFTQDRDRTIMPGELLSMEQVTKDYYNLQNKLGYSLKEIQRGKSLAGVELDLKQINPVNTRVVWNERELNLLRSMPKEIGDEFAQKFGIQTVDELIILQEELLK